MNVDIELQAYLKASTPIEAFVGDRIYPMVAPQGSTTPYIRYQNIKNADLTSVQGDNYGNKAHIQLDIFSTSYTEVKEILGAVRLAMYQYKYFPHEFNAKDEYDKDALLYRQLIEFKLNTKE